MKDLDVTMDAVRGRGSAISTVGESIGGQAGNARAAAAAGAGSPPATERALESLASEWAGGLQRLGEGATGLGKLTVGVSQLYEVVEHGIASAAGRASGSKP